MVPAASVVIPAHDEARVIVRTLAALYSGLEPGALDVVVVCNGCTDATAGLARAFSPAVRVLEIPVASKAAAVRAGNEACEVFPRVHLDADVQLTGPDLLALVRPLVEGDVLATAPRRVLPREGSARLVRWYYDVWEELPQVRAGLFGRGAIALSEAGQRRVDALPQLMSDDLGLSEAFDPGERLVVETAQVDRAAAPHGPRHGAPADPRGHRQRPGVPLRHPPPRLRHRRALARGAGRLTTLPRPEAPGVPGPDPGGAALGTARRPLG